MGCLGQPAINGYFLAGSLVGPGGLKLIKEIVQVSGRAGPVCAGTGCAEVHGMSGWQLLPGLRAGPTLMQHALAVHAEPVPPPCCCCRGRCAAAPARPSLHAFLAACPPGPVGLPGWAWTSCSSPWAHVCLLTACLLNPSSNLQVQSVAQLGVHLLLFTLGLEFSLTKLRAVRNVALFGGLLQARSQLAGREEGGLWAAARCWASWLQGCSDAASGRGAAVTAALPVALSLLLSPCSLVRRRPCLQRWPGLAPRSSAHLQHRWGARSPHDRPAFLLCYALRPLRGRRTCSAAVSHCPPLHPCLHNGRARLWAPWWP